MFPRCRSKYGRLVNYTCQYCPNKVSDVNDFDGWTWAKEKEGEIFAGLCFWRPFYALLFVLKSIQNSYKLQSWSVTLDSSICKTRLISLRIPREQYIRWVVTLLDYFIYLLNLTMLPPRSYTTTVADFLSILGSRHFISQTTATMIKCCAWNGVLFFPQTVICFEAKL